MSNGLALAKMPSELKDLTSLEVRLISKRIPFMKIFALPAGRQNGIRGAVVNVPTKLSKISSLLPRVPTDAHMISLKLKRRIAYSSYYMYEYIRPTRVVEAFRKLKEIHPSYHDTTFNVDWESEWADNDEEVWSTLTCKANVKPNQSNRTGSLTENAMDVSDGYNSSLTSMSETISDKNRTENTIEAMDVGDGNNSVLPSTNAAQAIDMCCENNSTNQEVDVTEQENQAAFDEAVKLRGMPLDFMLQEEDLNSVFSIAPGEGQRPQPILDDDQFEITAFPNLFPTGIGCFKSLHQVNLTPSKYFNQRILNGDGRFARDLDYLFSAQYAVEKKQVFDQVSIVLRQTKGATNSLGNTLNAGSLRNAEQVQSLIRDDYAYRGLSQVRGSPPYWAGVQHDLMAMLRQLGKPAWFLTLSAADMQWAEVIQSIGIQYGENFSVQDIRNMSYTDKCKWLRSNPVTTARMFSYRLDQFFTHFLLKCHPLGEISDHFVRIEFQARGSPHAHMLLWVKDAPEIGKNSDEEVIRFIDLHTTCKVPNDLVLQELVMKLQIHSHSASCRRNGVCRFNFPLPPSKQTIIAKEPVGEEAETEKKRSKSSKYFEENDNCHQQYRF